MNIRHRLSDLELRAAGARSVPVNARRFVGWIAEDIVATVSSDGSVSLQVVPLPAAVVRPYEPRAGDVVEVLRGRSVAIVLRKVEE